MKEDKEKLSAYLDDALPRAELDAFEHNLESAAASRYQMIGEVLRGQMGDASMIDVRLQVHEALEHDEIKQVQLGDENLDVSEAHGSKKTGKQRSIFDLAWLNPARLNPAWYKPVGGLAVAASVAMIMVVTVTENEMTSDSNLVAGLSTEDTTIKNPVVENTAENIATNNVLVVSTPVANEVGAHNSDEQLRSQVNLETYLAEHAEFAAQDTMQGRIPYARAVSYEAE